MNNLFLKVLQVDPRNLDMDDFKSIYRHGRYSGKCRICNSEFRELIDYLLSYHSTRRVAAYCNEFELFDRPIAHQSVYNHMKRHIYN